MTETPTRRGSDRPARVTAALVLTLAVVVGASTYVGFVGSHEERFGWELAAIFGTALGTTLLAVATGWLAWSTRSEVRVADRLGVTPKTVLRWTAARGLPGYRLGRALRYRESDVEAWLRRHATTDGAGPPD